VSPRSKKENKDEPTELYLPPRDVYEAESSSYWTGRFVSLSDKFLNDGEGEEIPEPSMRDGKALMRDQEERRARTIFLLLSEDCKTTDAKRSLLVRISPFPAFW